jgi:hypothetical protein
MWVFSMVKVRFSFDASGTSFFAARANVDTAFTAKTSPRR